MMIAAREAVALRRQGYRLSGRSTLIGQLVEDAGLRLRPMNRMQPRYGHWVADCPRCGHTDGLWIAPGWRSFSTSCGCVRGDAGPLALYGLFLRGVAA